MWFTLSKLLGYLLSPLPFTLALVAIGIVSGFVGARRFSRFMVITGGVLLYVCSMPVVERQLRTHLESQFPPVPIESVEPANLAVVLGGAVGMPSPPRIAVELKESSDRVLHAFRLYRAGKAQKIFLSAGNAFEDPSLRPEAEYIASLLLEWGVDEEDIAFGRFSRTTRENAEETGKYLRQNRMADDRVLLVTSAIHMPRALATFRGAGINAVPAATDFSAGPGLGPWILDYLPSFTALHGISWTWHEILGTWAYRLRGWF